MGGEQTRPMWVLLMLLLAPPIRAMCPARCRCNDDALQAECIAAGLEVVPIQLNPEVRHIELANNKITNVHFTLSFYNNLISLNLSHNKIKTLGSSNFELQRHLKRLNLSNNEVESLSKDAFKGLRALIELDLSFNRIEELPALTFRDLHLLEVLKLSGNHLVYLEANLLKPAKYLRQLLLDDNQLLEIPASAIGEAINLQYLSLSGNLLASISEGAMPPLTELRILLLDTNVIADIHPGALVRLPALENLDLSENNFTTVPTASLARLSNLTKLHFCGNFIRTVPPVAFRGLFQLRFLSLNRLGLLTRIDSRAFVDNINLERVYLDDNIALNNIPTRLFHGNPKLSYISIRNSQLTTLEASHFPLDQLRYLHLGGNPFQCNCTILWLWRLEREQTNSLTTNNKSDELYLIIDVASVRCAGPDHLSGVLLVEAAESQVGCSMGWLAAISTLTSLCLLLVALSAFLYCGPVKRRMKKREIPPREINPCSNGTDLTRTYNDSRADKFIIGPPLISEYRSLPQWENFSKSDEMDNYQQFDTNYKAKPHIVYV